MNILPLSPTATFQFFVMTVTLSAFFLMVFVHPLNESDIVIMIIIWLRLQTLTSSAPVMVFMKGTPEVRCACSHAAMRTKTI